MMMMACLAYPLPPGYRWQRQGLRLVFDWNDGVAGFAFESQMQFEDWEARAPKPELRGPWDMPWPTVRFDGPADNAWRLAERWLEGA